MSPVQMVPTENYRQIGPGDLVFGAGRFLGEMWIRLGRDLVTYNPELQNFHKWTYKNAVHLFSFYEDDNGLD